MMFRVRLLLVFVLVLQGCNCRSGGDADGGTGGGTGGGAGGGGGGTASVRCETDLERFKTATTGALTLKQIASPSDLIGGPTAYGKVGDYLLANEKIKVIVQGLDRHIGAQPFGGTILDADFVRGPGEPGQDQFGELGLLYNFGRTLDPEHFEILSDGADGHAVVLAVTGPDTANDYLSIRNQLRNMIGNVPAADPYVAVPLKITNYFILNPGEQRVRFVTALCNTGPTETVLAVGDLTDPGYTLELFDPQACTAGFGYGGLCFGLDRMNWYGYQGNGIAYGYAPYKVGGPTTPEAQNAILTVAGITGTIIGAPGLTGILNWFDLSQTTRPGELRIPGLGIGVFSRDFVIGHDLGEVNNLIVASRAAATGDQTGQLEVTVTSSGTPLEGARVTLEGTNSNVVLVTGANGKATATLEPRAWMVSAWAKGRLPSAKTQVLVTSSSTPSTLSFDLVSPRTLTVNVREANGGAMPARVTVLCAAGPCPSPQRTLVLYGDTLKDPMPDNVQAIAFAGASGTAVLQLPPGQYLVLVSRGPEYSIFPNTFPTIPGAATDLRTTDATINAVLAHVVDTTGWVSADFHVHAVNSPDSIVDDTTRVTGHAADGFDVIVSTDHDYVTDFAPVVSAAGLSPFIASMIGEEISTMDWGHYNFFPLVPDSADLITRGALDWAGGRGPTLNPALVFAEGRKRGATSIQFNHPRGYLGGLQHLRADTDTFATHAPPESFRMAPMPNATANDTKLLSQDFNAFEIFNNGDDLLDGTSDSARSRENDWLTLISRGVLVAATGTSDTHTRAMTTGWRTFVETGIDSPAQFDPMLLATRLNALRALVTNGPFVKLTAYRVDSSGAQVTPSMGPGATVAADARDLGVTVDVQVPEYLDVTRVELYLHQSQDDLACPIDLASPRAATTRVACNGVANTNWPPTGISATQTIALNAGDLQTVTTDSGVTYRRYRRLVNFRLPAPTTDNFVVAMVYGTRSLFPLIFNPPGSSGAVTPTSPYAMTNPVFIDADGNGYDKPPFKPTGMARRTSHHGEVLPVAPPESIEELLGRWGAYVGTH